MALCSFSFFFFFIVIFQYFSKKKNPTHTKSGLGSQKGISLKNPDSSSSSMTLGNLLNHTKIYLPVKEEKL